MIQEQLKQLAAWARTAASLGAHLKGRDNMRLRPSAGGFSLVSCGEATPQLGFSGLHGEADLLRRLPQELRPPRRLTPEKDLQSALIREAARNGGRLPSLSRVFGDEWFFVTDEIALRDGLRKFVADMLFVRVDREGLAWLENGELKSLRSMKVFEQTLDFRSAILNPVLRDGWRELSEVMTGRTFKWAPSAETKGVVIWPRGSAGSTAAAGFRSRFGGINVAGYEKDPASREYSFVGE
jgi:hypothetical protein